MINSILFISPHFDDICFSLGGMLPHIRAQRKTLINIFTRSGWMSNPIILSQLQGVEGQPRVDAIGALRDSEDNAFALPYGFHKTNLDFLDADLVAPPGNANPAQFYEDAEAEVDQVYQVLLPLVQTNVKEEPKTSLMAPLAIGAHRNHLVTFAVITKIAARLPHIPVIFYEDLPYAVEPQKRQARLAQLEPFLRAEGYQRYRKDMDAAAYTHKTSDVLKYASQMNRGLDNYAIRTPECPERHEAIWAKDVETIAALF